MNVKLFVCYKHLETTEQQQQNSRKNCTAALAPPLCGKLMSSFQVPIVPPKKSIHTLTETHPQKHTQSQPSRNQS